MINCVSEGEGGGGGGEGGKPASKKLSRALDLQKLISYAERRWGGRGFKKGGLGKDS